MSDVIVLYWKADYYQIIVSVDADTKVQDGGRFNAVFDIGKTRLSFPQTELAIY
jgi:hypothetical protein